VRRAGLAEDRRLSMKSGILMLRWLCGLVLALGTVAGCNPGY
jgi:hypothetical protein